MDLVEVSISPAPTGEVRGATPFCSCDCVKTKHLLESEPPQFGQRDIHINNPKESDQEKLYKLSEQLVKYITLMKHPGLITPSAIERCMQIAYNAKLNSA